jgi:alpha-methylacyl-CoA racemase
VLEGITVLDLSSVGPGPRCTWLLADLGADVVKIVAPASAGRIEPDAWAYGGGRGTRRVEIDLRADPEAFLALCVDAQVVVEAFRPGVADRLGVGYEAVRVRNPKIVYAAITGYGQHDARAHWAGHDLNYLGVAGYIAEQGNRLPGATIADSAGGGMHAAISILAALVKGDGAYLDVSTTHGSLFFTALAVDRYLATGEHSRLLTGGNACYDVYECGDGRSVTVAAIESKFFTNLCRELGFESLAKHQYDDTKQDELRTKLRETFLTRSRDEWVQLLADKDTCVAPVLTIEEVAATFPTQDGGGFRQLAPVIAR